LYELVVISGLIVKIGVTRKTNVNYMKSILRVSSIAFSFCILSLVSCQKEDQPIADAEQDARPLFVGNYICEVTKKNFETDVLLKSYQDTIQIVEQGEKSLSIRNTRYVQLPEVKFLNNYQNPLFVSEVTIVSIDYDKNLNIVYGLDSAFYEFKSFRKF